MGQRDILKSDNKQRILGEEWAMYEVGIIPTHDLDNPNGIVASINNNSKACNMDLVDLVLRPPSTKYPSKIGENIPEIKWQIKAMEIMIDTHCYHE